MKYGKEEYLSITDMAKLRDVTTETLRHYDRIGLLPPDYVNEHNVRYYSVLKYEKLGTIKELKQLGMSLKEIRSYFENRNYKSSRELLEKQRKLIQEQMKSLMDLQEKINSKIDFMDSLEGKIRIGEPYRKILPKRYYLQSENKVENEIELSYEAMRLEQKIYEKEKYLPIYAAARYGSIFSLEERNEQSVQLIVFIENAENMEEKRVLPEGNFLCVQSRGTFWERNESIRLLYQEIRAKNYRIRKPIVIENVLVDYSITDVKEERLFEFQIPIF